ncbi:MAG: dynamin family protein, partial [Rhodospirillales bacterium]|nr:dynamin family protein [Rhodospirillales bacterium]
MTEGKHSYLARLRMDANITQATMARIMGVAQNQISRWERNPNAMNAGARDEYLRNCGFPPPQTVAGLVPPTVTGLAPDAAARDALQANIRVLSCYVDTVSPPDSSPSEELPGSLPAVKDLLENVRFLARKPRIGVVGRFDQGKSRLVNTLLGSDCLPTAYQPDTSLICLVRHISDRPEWMQADPEFMNQDAFVFKSDEDTEIVENGDIFVGQPRRFDFRRLDDADYFRRLRCVSGGLEILRDFGTKRGRHATRAKEQDMVAALAFVDVPLLQTCDVLDFPGYDDGDSGEWEKPEFARTLFDIPIYVSGCIGFFNAADREYIDSLIKQLPPVEDKDSPAPPLRNAFFVATRASHFDGEDIDKEILDPAAERTHRHLEGSLRNVQEG